MQEYRDRPKQFLKPTDQEVKARTKRNVVLALGLLPVSYTHLTLPTIYSV